MFDVRRVIKDMPESTVLQEFLVYQELKEKGALALKENQGVPVNPDILVLKDNPVASASKENQVIIFKKK